MITGRILLEPLRADHAAEMTAVLSAPALYTFTGGGPPTLADLTRRYTAQIAGSGDQNEEWLNWIVRRVGTGEAIGFVQATVEPDATEIAWTIGTAWQGNGYAKEAAHAMCELLHDRGVKSLTAWIHPEHTASHNVALSLGLVRTTEVDEDGEERWERAPV